MWEAQLTSGLVFVLVLAAALIAVIVMYNSLVGKRQLAGNGWSDIDVQLKRRADLVPMLVNTVKGYAAHERALFEEIAERRTKAISAGDDPAARAAAEGALARPVGRLMAIAESYPDLKASENFLQLQRELAETEDKIEMARRFYNGAVRELNTLVASVPSNLVANAFGFKERQYFEIADSDRATPRVDMGGAR
jgi:LemA protein